VQPRHLLICTIGSKAILFILSIHVRSPDRIWERGEGISRRTKRERTEGIGE
jgi:hypothetical protein